jgi:hypothetical protein
MGRIKGALQTGEVASYRRERSAERSRLKRIVGNSNFRLSGEELAPEVFSEIHERYWKCLKSVPDPRKGNTVVYPLYQILHRILSSFLQGTYQVGVAFPKKHPRRRPGVKRVAIGTLPTRNTVYRLLEKIDWHEANRVLGPLWEVLGYTPDFIMKSLVEEGKQLVDSHKESMEEALKEGYRVQQAKQLEEAKILDAQGLSAAKAKRTHRNYFEPEKQTKKSLPKKRKQPH